MDDSKFFAEWLARQDESGILPTQIQSVAGIMDRLPNSDLICVMYFGADSQALRALNLLKDRFQEERSWLAEMAEDIK